MSSIIFQPLLNDTLGWKPSTTTYNDHYKWRKQRSKSKDKKVSTYGQQYIKQLKKQKQKSSPTLSILSDEDKTINRVIIVRKTDEDSTNNDKNQEREMTCRYSPSKTPIYIVEYKQRPPTADTTDVRNSAKAPQRPVTAPVINEEKAISNTQTETRPPSKEEKPKLTVDPNNDNSRHWLTYPNPKTPQYITDIKQRLGQLKIPSTLARPSSASNASVKQQSTETTVSRPSSASNSTKQQQQQQQVLETIARPTSAVVVQQKTKQDDDQHHFLTYHTRQTPEELRAARYRLDKHRYHPSLDSYPPRPQTCPIRTAEAPRVLTPPKPENEQVPIEQTKTDAWVADEEKKATTNDDESSSVLIQMVDCEGLPNEYVVALETANAAQEEYQKYLKKNIERRHENSVDHFSVTLPTNKTDSLQAVHQNRDQTGEMNNQVRQVARTSQSDFGAWVRHATDKERASTMKLLQDVLRQPIMGYDASTKHKPVFKQPPAPPPVRTTSATRKLGRTRTQHRFPCEICEKLLIKRHVWDLSGSETLTCSHRPQGTQVQT